MNKKGQAALEYLMTYGWGLVIVVVFAGVLFVIAFGEPVEQEQNFCIDYPEELCCENDMQIVVSQSSDITTLGKPDNGFEKNKLCWIESQEFVCAICTE